MRWIALTKADDWRSTHEAADAALGRLVDLLLTLFHDVRTDLTRAVLVQALNSGTPVDTVATLVADVWESLALDNNAKETLQDALHEVITSSAETAWNVLGVDDSASATMEAAFNRVNERAVLYAEEQAARLLVDVSESTIQGVRSVVEASLRDGRGPDATARDIQRMVGLTDRQANAVARYAEALRESGTRETHVLELLDKRAERLREQRAETIMRTETMDAANAGQQSMWEESERQGWIPDTMRRYWLVARDDRLCPQCAPVPGMNPDGVGLHEQFRTPAGNVARPPLHPNCRCVATLRNTR